MIGCSRLLPTRSTWSASAADALDNCRRRANRTSTATWAGPPTRSALGADAGSQLGHGHQHEEAPVSTLFPTGGLHLGLMRRSGQRARRVGCSSRW